MNKITQIQIRNQEHVLLASLEVSLETVWRFLLSWPNRELIFGM